MFIELGILLALGVAFVQGIRSVYQRKNSLNTDEFITAWSSRVFGIPIIAAVLLYEGLPSVEIDFLLILIPQSLVISFTSILIAKAYKKSEASLVTPIFALSPILVIGTSFVILREIPSIEGLAGVLLIAIGTYFLKIEDVESFTQPFKNLLRERGVQLIFLVVLIYSVTANTDKIGVEMTSPVLWSLSVYLLSSIFMFPVMVRKSPEWKKDIKHNWKPLALLGGLGGISVILQMTAFELTLVTYVVAIKRLSIPLTVIISYFLLDEKESFRYRIIGSTIMVLGAILINI